MGGAARGPLDAPVSNNAIESFCSRLEVGKGADPRYMARPLMILLGAIRSMFTGP